MTFMTVYNTRKYKLLDSKKIQELTRPLSVSLHLFKTLYLDCILYSIQFY